MRRSPGSSRTMTSPKLTRSQRQSFFGLIVNAMRLPQPPVQAKTYNPPHSHEFHRMIPDSCLRCSTNPSWLHSGSENMDHRERHQIGGASNEKRNHVASGPLQHIPHHFRNAHSPNPPPPSAYT